MYVFYLHLYVFRWGYLATELNWNEPVYAIYVYTLCYILQNN